MTMSRLLLVRPPRWLTWVSEIWTIFIVNAFRDGGSRRGLLEAGAHEGVDDPALQHQVQEQDRQAGQAARRHQGAVVEGFAVDQRLDAQLEDGVGGIPV